MTSREFPSRLTTYDNWYTAEGYIPHKDGSQTQCSSSVFRTIVDLSSPPYSGPTSPVPTMPANNSGGHAYYPATFPKVMRMSDWHYFQSAFPDVLALQYCQPVLLNNDFQFKPPIAITKHTLDMPSRYPEPTPVASGTTDSSPISTCQVPNRPPVVMTSIFGHAAVPGPSIPSEGTSPSRHPTVRQSVPQPVLTSSEETANSAPGSYRPIIVPSDQSLQTPAASTHANLASPTSPQPQETAILRPLASATNSIAHEHTETSADTVPPANTTPTSAVSLGVDGQYSTENALAQPVGAPKPTGNPVLSLAGTNAVLIGTRTLSLGHTITLGTGSSTTEVALVTNSLGQTELVCGQSSSTIHAASELTPAQALDHAIVINDHTLALGSTITLGSGSSATEVALVTNSKGQTEIVHDLVSMTALALSDSVFGIPVTKPISGVVIGDKTLQVGSSVTLGQGAATTMFALSTDDTGRIEIIQGHATAIIGSSDNVFGKPITAPNADVVIGCKTLEVGSTITLGSGPAKTEVALGTNALGQTKIVQGQWTTVITPIGSGFGEPVSPVSGGIVIGGKTLELGSTITLDSAASTTRVALETNGLGQTEIIEGQSTEVLLLSTTSEGLVVESGASGAVVIDGHTLGLGSTITLGSGAQTTEIALETNSLGQTEIIEGTTTDLLMTSRMGSYILSGMQTRQPTSSTPPPASSGKAQLSAVGQASVSKSSAGRFLPQRRIETLMLLLSILGFLFMSR